EIMVIGGASIYEQILPFADKIYLTMIEKNFEGDAWFTELSMEDWKTTAEEKHEGDPPFVFLTLERICC
ncbi:MAG: dihydrofolate reductase, partial [Micavibrio aeruginosavorus]